MPKIGGFKYNCDGTSKGNPGESSYAYCVRDHNGDLIWAEVQKISISIYSNG